MINYLYGIIKKRVDEKTEGKEFPFVASYTYIKTASGLDSTELNGCLNQMYEDGIIGTYNAINDRMIYIKKTEKENERSKE